MTSYRVPLVAVAVAVVGCGRLHFDDTASGGDASHTPGDGTSTLDSTICDELAATYFCDGMESSALAAWERNDASAPQEIIERDTAQPYRGVASVRSETTIGSSSTALIHPAFPTLTSGDLYLRAYVWLPADASTWDTIPLNATASNQFRAQAGIMIRTDGIVVFNVASAGIRVGGTAGLFPRDRWVCIESHLRIDDITGLAEFWIDGEHFGMRDNIDTLPPMGGYTHLFAGLSWTEVPTRLYIDEVVASSQRIGCD